MAASKNGMRYFRMEAGKSQGKECGKRGRRAKFEQKPKKASCQKKAPNRFEKIEARADKLVGLA